MGIDEAGRGPVIGPLVFCGYTIKESRARRLKKIGVRDSKELSIQRMREIFPELERYAENIFYIEVDPALIDSKNLSEITFEKIVELINSSRAEVVYFDAPVPQRFVDKYVSRIKKSIEREVEVIGAIKGDKKFPSVSAASICAKLKREERIEELKKNYGDFGSGYPGDAKTLSFIRECLNNGVLPDILRKKWETLKKIEFLSRQQTFGF